MAWPSWLGGSSNPARTEKRVATRTGTKPEGSFLGGTPEYFEQVPLFSKGQEAAFSKSLGIGMEGLQALLSQLGQPVARPSISPLPSFNFEPIAQKARERFMTKTIPSLAERFVSLGGPQGEGAVRSGAYPATLGSAGAELESSLADLESKYALKQAALQQAQQELGLKYGLSYDEFANQRQQQIANILGILTQLGSQQRFQSAFHPAQQGLGQSILGGVGTGLANILGGAGNALAGPLVSGAGNLLKTLNRF